MARQYERVIIHKYVVSGKDSNITANMVGEGARNLPSTPHSSIFLLIISNFSPAVILDADSLTNSYASTTVATSDSTSVGVGLLNARTIFLENGVEENG